MESKPRILLSCFALGFALLTASAACAAPDDEEPAPEVEGNPNFNVNEANFDQWVFPGGGGANAGRKRIQDRLKLQLDELNRVCGLTDAQQQKLSLAARGDMKRFFDQVEELRKKFLEVRQDQNAFGLIWQEIQPLQRKQASGLFNDPSLYSKIRAKTLSVEQSEKYRAVLEERQRFRYRASVEVAMTTLENSVALDQKQREALAQLLIDKTQPPEAFGQHDYNFVMYRLARLPEQEVKSLLDERQWKTIQPQLTQGRNMKAMLIQNGVVSPSDPR